MQNTTTYPKQTERSKTEQIDAMQVRKVFGAYKRIIISRLETNHIEFNNKYFQIVTS